MNILLLGSGGREHALSWKISQSKEINNLYIAPGNAGTLQTGKNIDLNPKDFEEVGDFALANDVRLIVVGPEEPLVNGIYDYFKTTDKLSNILIVGPSKEGAQLEGSKDFAKDFMQRHHIPTAAYKTFTSNQLKEAEQYLRETKPPYVLKADGLAAGKGVVIVDDLDSAVKNIREMLQDKKFGAASEKVVIEQFLSGIELSVFVLTDGNDWLLLPEAKDYKRIGEGDTGLNTGGMGSISPVPFANEAFMKKVKDQIIQPTIDGIKKDGIDFKGFIFFGLINVDDQPFVIEYNVRMGDPETESVIPRIKSDLVPLLKACAEGNLGNHSIEIDKRAAATVMLVSGGYPEAYSKGYEIAIGESANEIFPADSRNENSVIVFHAGTAFNEKQQIISAGGRVIAVTSLAATPVEALQLSYETAKKINFKDKYYRKDIGFDIL